MAKQPNMFDWQKAYFQSGDPSLRATYPTMAVLASYADFDERTCYPSQRTIAAKLGYKKPETVGTHIKANIEAGWLVKIREGNSRTTTNMYRFEIPTPPVNRGSQALDNSPRESGELDQLPPENGVHSPRRTGSTPPAERGLTTKGTTEGTNQVPEVGVETFAEPLSGLAQVLGDGPAMYNHSGSTPPAERGSSPDELLTPDEYRARTLAANTDPWEGQEPTPMPPAPPPSTTFPKAVNPFGPRTA